MSYVLCNANCNMLADFEEITIENKFNAMQTFVLKHTVCKHRFNQSHNQT